MIRQQIILYSETFGSPPNERKA
uniref:Uncharacterized protein n=1 Tax=Tetranychus urticae TaxID=32264 RepID=T1JSG6_TETUR